MLSDEKAVIKYYIKTSECQRRKPKTYGAPDRAKFEIWREDSEVDALPPN